MAIRSSPFLKRVMEAGEAQVDRLVGQLWGNERFVAAVQSVVSRTLDAKGTLDKRIRAGLATMHLPTTQDVEELRAGLGEVRRMVEDLGEKVAKIEQALATQPATKAASTRTQGRVAKAPAKPKAAAAAKVKAASTSKAKATSGAKAKGAAKPPASSTRSKAASAKAGAGKAQPKPKPNGAAAEKGEAAGKAGPKDEKK